MLIGGFPCRTREQQRPVEYRKYRVTSLAMTQNCIVNLPLQMTQVWDYCYLWIDEKLFQEPGERDKFYKVLFKHLLGWKNWKQGGSVGMSNWLVEFLPSHDTRRFLLHILNPEWSHLCLMLLFVSMVFVTEDFRHYIKVNYFFILPHHHYITIGAFCSYILQRSAIMHYKMKGPHTS